MIKPIVFALLSAQLLSPAFAGEKTYGDLDAICLGNYDGDTLTVDVPGVHPLLGEKVSVRVRGIDTPELHGTVGEAHVAAVAAKIFVANSCPVGSAVSLGNVGRDKYFRIDADVRCGDVNIARELVGRGLAHDNYEGGKKAEW